jgi:tripeptide aminopeptidase
MVDKQLLQRVKTYYTERLEDMVAENIAVCEVPAPPFMERERAEYLARRLREVGADDVQIDDTPNVYAEIRGAEGGPTLLLAAHLDTVFPEGTDVTVKRIGHELHAPGIRDDSTAVASLIHLVKGLREMEIPLRGRLILVGTAGEEGLGDLRGMKAAMARYGQEVDLVIAVDGNLGGVIHAGIASRRLRVLVSTGGGHSWGDFGVPSAIHTLGRMIADISHLEVPADPRTTYNVGVISGGTSINTIAQTAEMLIDMRSTSDASLAELERQVRAILERHATASAVELETEVVGDRPGGALPADHSLVQLANETLRALDITPSSAPSSTDANVPLSQGIPAICIGITTGSGAHRLDESLDIRPIPLGMTQLCLLVATLLR